MSVKTAQLVVGEFCTANPATAAAQNGDALPTGILYVDGTADGASVTVTNKDVGAYSFSVTLPALTAGQIVGLRISAVVAGVAGTAIVWQDSADTYRLSDALGATFTATEDSLEAIRNRGDLAWATGAGAAADKFYVPSGAPTIATKHADAVGGAYTDLAVVDGNYFSIREVATTNPPLDFYFPFAPAAGVFPASLHVWGYYSGSQTHWMRVQAAVAGVTSVWEDIGTIPNGSIVTAYNFPLTPQHINPTTGAAYIRFLHNAVSGQASHYLYLDKLLFTATSYNTDLLLALKLLRNKVVTNPATGVMSVYDDNGSDVLYTANVYEDVAGSVPFDGTGANRRDRLA